MARGLWKGAISFGLVNIPIELYSAEKRNDLSFSLLDKRDLAPVGYQRINKSSGETVPWEQIAKGYEYEDGRYVVLTNEDFKRANVEATQTIEIVSFVRAEEISPLYFETPYYLVPGKRGEKGYALLRETLRRSGRVGVAQVVLRTKQHLAIVTAYEEALVLIVLRYAHELRPAGELSFPAEDLNAVGVKEKEVELALRLVNDLTEAWKPEAFHDTYREDLMSLIEKRIESGDTQSVDEHEESVPEATKGADVIDLMALLKRSVESREAQHSPPPPAEHQKRKPSRPRGKTGGNATKRKRA